MNLSCSKMSILVKFINSVNFQTFQIQSTDLGTHLTDDFLRSYLITNPKFLRIHTIDNLPGKGFPDASKSFPISSISSVPISFSSTHANASATFTLKGYNLEGRISKESMLTGPSRQRFFPTFLNISFLYLQFQDQDFPIFGLTARHTLHSFLIYLNYVFDYLKKN